MNDFRDETVESGISSSSTSSSCDATEKTHISTKTKPQRHKASIRKQNRPRYEHDDPPHVSPLSSEFLIPSSTSHWNITHLDSLRIFYDSFSRPVEDLLHMVFQQTGQFAPLTDVQRVRVKEVQDRMTFSCNLSDVQRLAMVSSDCPPSNPDDVNVYEEFLKHVKEEGLLNDCISHENVQNFVIHLVMIMRWIVTDSKLPEAVFEDLFKIFINMCGLIASDGRVWRSEKVILNKQCRVTSEADIAVITKNHVEAFSSGRDMLTLVSIVGVKNLTHFQKENPETKKRPPSRKASGSDSSADCERTAHRTPSIFYQIGSDVLGQHAGELLIHTDKYGKNLNTKDFIYRPGVIVVGTKVTLTLLVCRVEHWLEIRTRNDVDRCTKALIYYSDQKDLLKKNDRDQLLESFARLKNSHFAK